MVRAIMKEEKNNIYYVPYAMVSEIEICNTQGVVSLIIVDNRFNGERYLHFQQNLLPEFLKDVPFATRAGMYLQYDVYPAHSTRPVVQYLTETYRSGAVVWPPWSPDLTSLYHSEVPLLKSSELRVTLSGIIEPRRGNPQRNPQSQSSLCVFIKTLAAAQRGGYWRLARDENTTICPSGSKIRERPFPLPGTPSLTLLHHHRPCRNFKSLLTVPYNATPSRMKLHPPPDQAWRRLCDDGKGKERDDVAGRGEGGLAKECSEKTHRGGGPSVNSCEHQIPGKARKDVDYCTPRVRSQRADQNKRRLIRLKSAFEMKHTLSRSRGAIRAPSSLLRARRAVFPPGFRPVYAIHVCHNCPLECVRNQSRAGTTRGARRVFPALVDHLTPDVYKACRLCPSRRVPLPTVGRGIFEISGECSGLLTSLLSARLGVRRTFQVKASGYERGTTREKRSSRREKKPAGGKSTTANIRAVKSTTAGWTIGLDREVSMEQCRNGGAEEKEYITEETRRPVASSVTIPTCENMEANLPGI
ncbi:hypothetical protein PR048_015166 [Dryococelus australis]|uniref:Uncharacterized protein n=1 Tax=Dryococelus australis TaxID=614101 RepID=A0ABQ9HG75_9NEOP|nr:hypothetical protein PR048_015166 [Dryococelus australis]